MVSRSVYNILKQKESKGEIFYQEKMVYDSKILNQMIKIEMLENILKELMNLSLKQQNRIYEKYILEMTNCETAQLENYSECAVRNSINRGLVQTRQTIKWKILKIL